MGPWKPRTELSQASNHRPCKFDERGTGLWQLSPNFSQLEPGGRRRRRRRRIAAKEGGRASKRRHCCIWHQHMSFFRRNSALSAALRTSLSSQFEARGGVLPQLQQWRLITKVRLKWVKNKSLDHVIDTETDLKAASLLKDAIKRSSTGFLTARSVADWQKLLGLTVPVLRFLRRCKFSLWLYSSSETRERYHFLLNFNWKLSFSPPRLVD